MNGKPVQQNWTAPEPLNHTLQNHVLFVSTLRYLCSCRELWYSHPNSQRATLRDAPSDCKTMTAVHQTRIRIANIFRGDQTQSRAAVDPRTVKQYSELLADGYASDPVVVFYDGANYRLADGFHRVQAALLINCTEIDAEVRSGGRDEAQWYSIQCNAKHGRPRTRADIMNAFRIMLDHPNSRGMSNREIASHIHV